VIHRQNYLDVMEHLAYRAEVLRDAQGTQENRDLCLRVILVWADETPLANAEEVRPALPDYVASPDRNDGDPWSLSYQESVLSAARVFFRWAKLAHPRRYRSLSLLYLDSLQVVPGQQVPQPTRSVYTVAEVTTLATARSSSLRAKRARAAIALLFLSGMRADAFVSMPIQALDLAALAVEQRPALGVRTKLRKSATTFLLHIPELLEVAREWDALVRQACPPDTMWYADIQPDEAGDLDIAPVAEAARYRARTLRHDLRRLCKRAGVRYRAPHAARRGHAQYLLANATTISDYRAVAKNLMHENLATSDIYNDLVQRDVQARIAKLSGGAPSNGAEGSDGATSRQQMAQALIREALALMDD
jgi:integrase